MISQISTNARQGEEKHNMNAHKKNAGIMPSIPQRNPECV